MSTLTPFVDMNPVPRVLVDVPMVEFPAGSVTVSLQSTCGGQTIDVRSGQRLPASSPLVVLDPEPGFGVLTSYTVIGYDAGGLPVGSWPVGSVTVDFDGVVIQQPLDPRLSVQVERMWETGSDLSRPSPFDLTYPQGRSLPGLVGLGPRRGLVDVGWELYASSAADADALQSTLGSEDSPQLPVWLIRTPPDQRIPRRFFCAVSSLVEKDTYLLTSATGIHFAAKTTEVRPPAASVSASVLTYSDVGVFFTSYAAVGAVYATYSDIARDTSLIGAADV